MSTNTRIWDALYKTDPKHTKPFKRAGGFSGTATKPIWLTKRLTEYFGPAGIGWGMDKPEFQTVASGEEILVFCTVALWYTDGDKRGIVYGVGGDKVLGKNKYGLSTNDEAFKAAYTDALSNAMKQIGVAADIHMGMFEDQKYLREVTEEFKGGGVMTAATNSIDDARREIEQQTGNGKSTYDLTKERKAIALLCDTARLAIGSASNRLELKDWWLQNKTELRNKLPSDDYEAIVASVEARRDELPAVAA